MAAIGLAKTEMEQPTTALARVESVTEIENGEGPRIVGVPDTTPVAGSRESPVGKEPAVIVKRSGGTSPDTGNRWE
jgi:hypothetical protein